jgi:ubiquinone/menaquinone biosynthesis C-methylase UbiE
MNTEDAAETLRLIEQDALFTQAMGGLLPELPADYLAQAERVLDLACGPGGWVIDLAFAHPKIEVAGIDASPSMIEYANARARSQHVHNASFEVMDSVEPLAFSDHTFDVVNARFTIGFQTPDTWPRMLRECKRVLKPGGIMRLSECEMSISNSAAYQQLNGLLYAALRDQQRTFSVDGRSIGITMMLARLLRQAGFSQVSTRPFVLDASFESPLHYPIYKQMEMSYELLKPYLLHSGLTTRLAFDTLCRQMLIEMYQEDFACVSYGLTALGYA